MTTESPSCEQARGVMHPPCPAALLTAPSQDTCSQDRHHKFFKDSCFGGNVLASRWSCRQSMSNWPVD